MSVSKKVIPEFSSVPRNQTNNGDLITEPISDSKSVCINSHGHLEMVIKRRDSSPSNPTPLNYGKLGVHHSISKRKVTHNKQTTEELITTIALQEKSPTTDEYKTFVQCLSGVIPEHPTDQDIDNAVKELKGIFEKQSGASDVIGLWGELFCISVSSKPEQMIKGWQSSRSKHDFSYKNERVEVKCSTLSQGQREHTFSLSSLKPIPDTEIAVISVLTSLNASGQSTRDLYTDLVSRFQHLEQQITTQTFQKIGLSNNLIDKKLDYASALTNTRIYSQCAIPKPCNTEPKGVTQVKFKSDLTGAEALRTAQSPDGIIQSLIEQLES